MNLLTPHTDIRMERVGPDAVKVTDADEVTLLGAGTLELDDLQLAGRMFACLAQDNRVIVQGIERLAGRAVESVEQILDRPDLAAGIRSAREAPADRPPSVRPTVSGGLTQRWRREFPADIRDISVSGDGRLLLANGGEVACLAAATGATAWSRPVDAEGGASRVLASDIDGDGNSEALLGTADSQLIVLEGDSGEERWRRGLANMWNRGSSVSGLAVADLEGYGNLSVLAGTEGWFVNAFGHDGTPKWAEWFRYHAITALKVEDTDGDGRAEILVGTEYCTPLTVHNFDGSFRWSTFEQVGSHGNATTPRRGICLKHMVVCDLDRDGILEIVYGTEDGIGSTPSNRTMERNSGTSISWEKSRVIGIVVKEDVLIVACEYGALYGFDFDGTMKWRNHEAQWIHALAESCGVMAVAANRREVRTYDKEGRCQGLLQMPANVTSLTAAESGFVCATERVIALLDPSSGAS